MPATGGAPILYPFVTINLRRLPAVYHSSRRFTRAQPFSTKRRPRSPRNRQAAADMTTDTIPTGTVERDGKEFRTVKEGKATILVPQGAKIGEDKSEVQQVFYNPIQQFNRDLSVLAMKAYGEASLQRKREKFNSRLAKNQKKRKRDADAENDGNAAEKGPSNTQAQHGDAGEPPFKILDALSASGLRALRYAHEIPFLSEVVANDLSASAAGMIRTNVEHNGLTDKIRVNNDDALALMYRAIADDLTNKDRLGFPGKVNKWDVIDLDPYGSAAPFLDAALQAVRDDGGLLCITCTDSAVWAGHSYSEKAFALYGGTSIKGSHSHEVGLRLILNAIASSAARYGLDIEPLLSLSIDFYTKFFVRVTRSPQNVKFLGGKTMLLYSCDHGCGAWQTQHLMKSKVAPNKKGSGYFYKHSMALGPTTHPFCPHCGTKTHINGPMYAGRIHSPDFVRQVLDQVSGADKEVYGTTQRLEGVLQTALEENLPSPEREETVNPKEDAAAEVDPCPFYFVPSRLAGVISCLSPPDDMIRGALSHLGYNVVRSHCRAGSMKTNAPWSTIWWIMTEWSRQKAPIKTSRHNPSTPAWRILKNFGLIESENGSTEPEVGDADTEMKDSQPQKQNASSEREQAGSSPVSEAELELRKTLVFDEDLARLGRQTEGKRLVRYQTNPEKNWGPMNRAKAH